MFTAGETVIVTGAGRGIGRATALIAAREGLAVAVWDRAGDAAHATADAIRAAGGQATACVVDVDDDALVRAGLDAAFAGGSCPYLVNNAGPLSRPEHPIGFSAGIAQSLGSVHRVTEQWLSRAGEEAQAVVSISSISGTSAAGGGAEEYYPVGKAAIAAYMREIAVRRRGRPRANAVAPGVTITARTEAHLGQAAVRREIERSPLGRAAEPAEIGEVVCFLLSPRASHVNGVVLRVDGGYALT